MANVGASVMERCCAAGASIAAERAEEAAEAAQLTAERVAEAVDLAADAVKIARKAEDTADEAKKIAVDAKETADRAAGAVQTAINKADAVADALEAHKKDKEAHGASIPAAQGTIALRGTGGTLKVGTPKTDTDAVTKKYVDDLLAGVLPPGQGGDGEDGEDGREFAELAVTGTPGTVAATLPAGKHGDIGYIVGLGMYRLNHASTALVDGELAIASADDKGRWEQVLPATEYVLAAMGGGKRSSRRENSVTHLVEVTPDAIAARSSVTLEVFVNEAAIGDAIAQVTPPATLPAQCAYSYYLMNGRMFLRITNAGTAEVTPASAKWTITLIKE